MAGEIANAAFFSLFFDFGGFIPRLFAAENSGF
jgi:hypothetical protein